MDANELAELVPMLIEDKIESASSPAPIQPGPMHQEFPAWWFRYAPVLGVAMIYPDRNQLRITMGLAIDIPYGPDVSHEVNRLNSEELIFGRAFLVGNDESGLGAVLMQEIVFGEGLSWEYLPSIQNLILIMATLSSQAKRLAPELCERYQARSFQDDEAFFLQSNG